MGSGKGKNGVLGDLFPQKAKWPQNMAHDMLRGWYKWESIQTDRQRVMPPVLLLPSWRGQGVDNPEWPPTASCRHMGPRVQLKPCYCSVDEETDRRELPGVLLPLLTSFFQPPAFSEHS